MIIAAALGYLFGSIPVAVLIAGKRIDPREVGDGNPGWWNMRAAVGEWRAMWVFVFDILKGVIPTVIAAHLWGPWWWAYVAGIFAVIGHAFPVFAGFRGGKGILTFMGAMVAINPTVVLATCVFGLGVAVFMRNLPVGLRVMVFAVPVVQLFVDPATHVALTGVMMSIIGARFWASHTAVPAKFERDATSTV